jgi:Transglycosylase SLT domain
VADVGRDTARNAGVSLRCAPLAAALAAAACATAACAQPSPAPDPCPFARHAPRLAPAPPSPADPSLPWFHAVGLALADPGPGAFRNADPEATPRLVRAGTARVDTAAYRAFRRRVAPLLERWGRDRRLGINPALVAALLAKESGFDPRAVSTQAALGYAQLTFAADSDLRIIARADSLSGWMCREVRGWPRDPRFHAAPATAEEVRARVASGELRPETEYLLDPRTAARAAVLWLRLLEVTWTEDGWPGMYGDSARLRLNGGTPLTEGQLLDLVLASYNHGYPEVWALVREHGPAWKDHLPPEPRDYVERIRAYTVLFQRG